MSGDGNGGRSAASKFKSPANVLAAAALADKNPLINYEAEQALLAALMANNAVYDRVYWFLKPEHFADSLHARIYDAIGRLVAQGKKADVLTLKHAFDQDRALADVGGGKYLVTIYEAIVTVLNAEDYAHAICDLYLRRQMVQLAVEMTERAMNVSYMAPKPSELATEFEGRLFEITQDSSIDANLPVPASVYIEEAAQQLQDAYQRKDVVNGIKTGLSAVDELIGALMKGKQYILAGRPSMGKSSLAICVAEHAARTAKDPDDPSAGGYRVLFFSPEMPRTEVGIRQIAMEAKVSGFEGVRGRLRPDQIANVVESRFVLAGLPIWVDETASLTIAELCMKARQYHRKYGLDLIVVDYLQLVHPTRASDNRANDVAAMSRATKELAKQLNVAMLVLSQLSRQVEGREDKRPQLSDLRESGAIEQDADVVMFVYREIYYLDRAEPKDASKKDDWKARCDNVRDMAEVIVAKQRGGPVGTAHLSFDDTTTRFYDRPKSHDPPAYDGPESPDDMMVG